MDAQKTGTLIAQARRERGLTQKELSQALHVSAQAVSKWERGLNFPDLSLLEPLGDCLGLTVSELLSGQRGGEPREELLLDSLRLLMGQAGRKLRRWRRLAQVCLGVLLALALEPVPHILVLDEPLSGVDIEGEHQLLEMLDELRTEYDLSILLSTHDFATLGQFADKVILLNKRVLRMGPPEEVTASPEFYETFHLRMGKGGES